MSATWSKDVFFTIHAELPREGPGETADVAWAAEAAGTTSRARVLDAACGPGGDIGALLRVASRGHVTAIDKHAPFIEAAKLRWGKDARVTLLTGDYRSLEGPFDFIWCAGAVYFVGIELALSSWKSCLADGGAIAFSEPCYFSDTPSQSARAFWGDEYQPTTLEGIATQIEEAGFELISSKPVSDIAWESYYRPMEDRIAKLRRGADEELVACLDNHQAEIEGWRANKAETGYVLCVVKPKA